MKKTQKSIKSFMQDLKEDKEGILSGGFASLKGGFSPWGPLSNTGNCNNAGICTDTNSGECTNSQTCKGTNSGDCTNSVCLF